MISVVIPLYNKEKQIKETLYSVLNQKYQDFEIVIVDDGSTDNSVLEVQKVKDERIRLIHQQNAGVSAARNKGINESRGEFIAFLDADDEWDSNYLSAQYELIEKYHTCDVFATDYCFKNLRGEERNTIIRNVPFDSENGILTNYFRVAATSNPPLWTSAVVVSREAIKQIGGFPVGVKSGEDLLTWARLAAGYKIAYSRRALATFKESADDGVGKPIARLGSEEFISNELIRLLDSLSPQLKKELKMYISQWYKMWGVILIEANKNHKAFKVAIDGLKWGGSVKHFIPLLVLSIMPKGMARSLFYKIR